MFDSFFKLKAYLSRGDRKFQSFFYRHRDALEKPCKQFALADWLEGLDAERLCELLASYAPIKEVDLEDDKLKKLLSAWNKRLPQDPHFFANTLKQLSIWRRFADKKLIDYLESSEADDWFSQRLKLRTRPHYELDCFYKRSKASALKRREQALELIRQNPLIRWVDLKEMGVRNPQGILESFPFAESHRKRYLQQLRAQSKSF